MLVKSKLKYIQTLGQKKFRQEEGLFIAEGPRLVAELLQEKTARIREIFALKSWIIENEGLVSDTVLHEVTEPELEKISQLSTPNKVLAILQQSDTAPILETKGRISLLLEGIRDPGNLGTIIRIADWFGLEQVVCSPDCAELYNPKVVQASMGSIVRVAVAYADPREWISAITPVCIFAAVLDGEDIRSLEKPAEGIIIIGNESRGISEELLEKANRKITIPRKGRAQSLNAAVAAGILLSHVC